MNDAAKRVRELRERTGKSVEEMASLLDMSRMSYFDIEFHDDELESVPSLKQVRQLAQYLGVSAAELVTGSTRDVNERIRWHDLVARTLDYRRTNGITEDAFEDLVGWKLDDFFHPRCKFRHLYRNLVQHTGHLHKQWWCFRLDSDETTLFRVVGTDRHMCSINYQPGGESGYEWFFRIWNRSICRHTSR